MIENFDFDEKTLKWIEKAEKVHNGKYIYDKDTMYTRVRGKIKYKCPEHGIVEQRAYDHLRGCGCPECAKYNKTKRIKITSTEELITCLKKIHGDKYDYSKTKYVNNKTPITMYCHEIDPITGEEHGEVKGSLGEMLHHSHPRTCRKCAGNFKKDTEYFIKCCKQRYGDKLTYEHTKYVNCDTKVTVTEASTGKVITIRPDNLLGKRGILFTEQKQEKTQKRTKKKRKFAQEKFIENAKSIYGDEYDFKDVKYVDKDTPVILYHKTKGKITAKPRNFLDKQWYYKDYDRLNKVCPYQKEYIHISKYTYEFCFNEAKKCNNIQEFRKTKAYVHSRHNNWVNDYTWFNTPSYEKQLKELIHIVYAYEFEDHSVYVGRTKDIYKRDIQHRNLMRCKHGTEYKPDSVLKKALELNVNVPEPKILEEHLNLMDSREMEDYWVNYYKECGWETLNKAKTGRKSGSIGGGIIIWTEEKIRKILEKETQNNNITLTDIIKKYGGGLENQLTKELKDEFFPNRRKPRKYVDVDQCIEIAKTFKTYKEFNEKHCVLAKRLRKEPGVLETIFNDYVKRKHNYWTYEKCREVSKECTRRADFHKKYPTAYAVSVKNRWINEFIPKNTIV